MTNVAHLIGGYGAVAMLALATVLLVAFAGRTIFRKGTWFSVVMLALSLVTTIAAQKQKPLNLRIYNKSAKGFDCAWDYGEVKPTDFRDGETVKLTAEITGMDYRLLLGTLPALVTNYHVNAVARGLPLDWMRHDLKVTAQCNNLLWSASGEHEGEEANELPSINDADGEAR